MSQMQESLQVYCGYPITQDRETGSWLFIHDATLHSNQSLESAKAAIDRLRPSYEEFLASKVEIAPSHGIEINGEINPRLKPHQAACVRWLVNGGRRALFASFGLGKSVIQLETLRLILEATGGRGLITLPLGVRQEFRRDAVNILGWAEPPKFIRSIEEAGATGIYLTNYETVRDGKLDPRHFTATSLDEAVVLTAFGASKTFREFMRLYEGVPYRFVATATPSPNEYIELLAYAAYLGVMDVSEGKTRFFKRDSTKADVLTLHKHKEIEFWLWVASWGLFLDRPSDLGFDDTGYTMPELQVVTHELPVDHTAIVQYEKDGQQRMHRETRHGVVDAAREKRMGLDARVAKAKAIMDESPEDHFIVWHDLEDERRAISAAIPGIASVWGSQDLEEREQVIIAFSDGLIPHLSTKLVIAGSGCNFQKHCHRAIFSGIGFKFRDFIQGVHRILRFGQTHPVRIDIIYTEAERGIYQNLTEKWQRHVDQVVKMREIVREFGLVNVSLAAAMRRSIGVERREVTGANFTLVNNDSVIETRGMESDSVDLILTSVPFSTQYEYTPSYNDMGHSSDNEQFFAQMDYLTPELLRVLRPGRLCCIHVKDRITPGGMKGLGFQTVYPFHGRCVDHYESHGFHYLGMKTIVTDVVRENNQTYRLGWSEQCKDGTKMGCGMPEYLLMFRKAPTDSSNGYADNPVVKRKRDYTRSRWQVDAHGFLRSDGNRLLTVAELEGLEHHAIFKRFREWSEAHVYNYEHHIALSEEMEKCTHCNHLHTGQKRCEVCDCTKAGSLLPKNFMLFQPASWHPDVWTDITRMLTLNGAQHAAGREMHLCLGVGSLVLTREHGYIPIEMVVPGDNVLTHMGRWRAVQVSQSTGMRDTICVNAQGVPRLILTPDHKVWVRSTPMARQREGASNSSPQWKESREIIGDYVNLKLPPVEYPSNDDLLHWWIVGRWIACGHWETRGAAIISCGYHKIDALLEKLGRLAGGRFDNETAVQMRVLDPNGTLKRTLRKCGNGATNKHLPPEASVLPMPQAAALLEGYISGDGSFTSGRERFQASTVSKSLALGIAMLAQRVHGTIASIHAGRPERMETIEGRTVHCNQEWGISFDSPRGDRYRKPFILADGAWKRVRSIETSATMETWCLQVDEDASFTAEGCIVKNCPMQTDLADRVIIQHSMPGELVYDPFGGIGTVPYRAIKLGRRGKAVELNPGYFTDSVIFCEAAEREMNAPTLFDMFAPAEEEIPVMIGEE